MIPPYALPPPTDEGVGASVVRLNVSEVFGPTIQGEGSQAGQLAIFMRLAGCNLTCSWCDSAYTWDWNRFTHREEVHQLTAEQVAEQIAACGPIHARIIITGGEPLLQSKGIVAVMDKCAGRTFDVETNGTRPLGPTAPFWSSIICSPKVIPSAGSPTTKLGVNLHPEVAGDPRTIFKFVVADENDLVHVRTFIQARGIPAHRVWLMPEGTDVTTLSSRTPWLMERATTHGYNFSTRLQVYGWGDERGH